MTDEENKILIYEIWRPAKDGEEYTSLMLNEKGEYVGMTYVGMTVANPQNHDIITPVDHR